MDISFSSESEVLSRHVQLLVLEVELMVLASWL